MAADKRMVNALTLMEGNFSAVTVGLRTDAGVVHRGAFVQAWGQPQILPFQWGKMVPKIWQRLKIETSVKFSGIENSISNI